MLTNLLSRMATLLRDFLKRTGTKLQIQTQREAATPSKLTSIQPSPTTRGSATGSAAASTPSTRPDGSIKVTETPNIIVTKISNWSSKAAPFVQPWEGLELSAKDDGFGNPTIGWGHTKGVKLGQKIDIPTAERLLESPIRTR